MRRWRANRSRRNMIQLTRSWRCRVYQSILNLCISLCTRCNRCRLLQFTTKAAASRYGDAPPAIKKLVLTSRSSGDKANNGSVRFTCRISPLKNVSKRSSYGTLRISFRLRDSKEIQNIISVEFIITFKVVIFISLPLSLYNSWNGLKFKLRVQQ